MERRRNPKNRGTATRRPRFSRALRQFFFRTATPTQAIALKKKLATLSSQRFLRTRLGRTHTSGSGADTVRGLSFNAIYRSGKRARLRFSRELCANFFRTATPTQTAAFQKLATLSSQRFSRTRLGRTHTSGSDAHVWVGRTRLGRARKSVRDSTPSIDKDGNFRRASVACYHLTRRGQDSFDASPNG